jgi:hypothetical protein
MFRLSAVQMNFSKQPESKNVQIKKNFAFLRCLDDPQFKCIFHKQSGSEIKVKTGSGYGSGTDRKIISNQQHW